MFIWPWLFDKGQKIPDRVRGALRFIENAQGDLAQLLVFHLTDEGSILKVGMTS
jgi:hypothetical protein